MYYVGESPVLASGTSIGTRRVWWREWFCRETGLGLQGCPLEGSTRRNPNL